MGKGYKHGGANPLNFKVVPGLTQPGTASENTIWVKTERINGWRFSAVKPKESRFRYIKLQMDSLTGEGSTVQFADVRFIKDDGSFFVYPSGTSVTASIAAASTAENETKLIDNNASTKYCSGAWVPGSYVLIDLGASRYVDIAQYKKWCWYTASDATTYPARNLKSFSLWGSNNGSTFELLDSVTDYNAPSQNSAVAYTGTIYDAPDHEPVNGEVLFVTGTSSRVKFNALKKNSIQVYPVSAHQYVNGLYVDIPVMSYQNGEWTPWYIEIFASGKGNVVSATARARNVGKGTISVSSNGIAIGYSGDWAGTDVLYYTDEPIDVTNLNFIKLTAQISEMRTSDHFNGFGLISSIPPVDGAWADQNWVATTEINDVSNVSKEFHCNISTVPPGKYYFLFVAAATRGKITDIRIE